MNVDIYNTDNFIVLRQKVEICTFGVLEQVNRIKYDCERMKETSDELVEG